MPLQAINLFCLLTEPPAQHETDIKPLSFTTFTVRQETDQAPAYLTALLVRAVRSDPSCRILKKSCVHHMHSCGPLLFQSQMLLESVCTTAQCQIRPLSARRVVRGGARRARIGLIGLHIFSLLSFSCCFSHLASSRALLFP